MAAEPPRCTLCRMPVTVAEKERTDQLILMCNHETRFYPLSEHGPDDLPAGDALPDAWEPA